jgi:hypothetical protein
VEEEKLILDYGLEVEENRPATCIPNQIRSQASIQALNWSFILDQRPENA